MTLIHSIHTWTVFFQIHKNSRVLYRKFATNLSKPSSTIPVNGLTIPKNSVIPSKLKRIISEPLHSQQLAETINSKQSLSLQKQDLLRELSILGGTASLVHHKNRKSNLDWWNLSKNTLISTKFLTHEQRKHASFLDIDGLPDLELKDKRSLKSPDNIDSSEWISENPKLFSILHEDHILNTILNTVSKHLSFKNIAKDKVLRTTLIHYNGWFSVRTLLGHKDIFQNGITLKQMITAIRTIPEHYYCQYSSLMNRWMIKPNFHSKLNGFDRSTRGMSKRSDYEEYLRNAFLKLKKELEDLKEKKEMEIYIPKNLPKKVHMLTRVKDANVELSKYFYNKMNPHQQTTTATPIQDIIFRVQFQTNFSKRNHTPMGNKPIPVVITIQTDDSMFILNLYQFSKTFKKRRDKNESDHKRANYLQDQDQYNAKLLPYEIPSVLLEILNDPSITKIGWNVTQNIAALGKYWNGKLFRKFNNQSWNGAQSLVDIAALASECGVFDRDPQWRVFGEQLNPKCVQREHGIQDDLSWLCENVLHKKLFRYLMNVEFTQSVANPSKKWHFLCNHWSPEKRAFLLLEACAIRELYEECRGLLKEGSKVLEFKLDVDRDGVVVIDENVVGCEWLSLCGIPSKGLVEEVRKDVDEEEKGGVEKVVDVDEELREGIEEGWLSEVELKGLPFDEFYEGSLYWKRDENDDVLKVKGFEREEEDVDWKQKLWGDKEEKSVRKLEIDEKSGEFDEEKFFEWVKNVESDDEVDEDVLKLNENDEDQDGFGMFYESDFEETMRNSMDSKENQSESGDNKSQNQEIRNDEYYDTHLVKSSENQDEDNALNESDFEGMNYDD